MPIICQIAGSVQLRNKLTEQFRVDLPATAVLDFPTVASLAEYISQSFVPSGATEVLVPHATKDLWSPTFEQGERGSALLIMLNHFGCLGYGISGSRATAEQT